jgi:hypothetical protein
MYSIWGESVPRKTNTSEQGSSEAKLAVVIETAIFNEVEVSRTVEKRAYTLSR